MDHSILLWGLDGEGGSPLRAGSDSTLRMRPLSQSPKNYLLPLLLGACRLSCDLYLAFTSST